jgi:hypothetical protein
MKYFLKLDQNGLALGYLHRNRGGVSFFWHKSKTFIPYFVFLDSIIDVLIFFFSWYDLQSKSLIQIKIMTALNQAITSFFRFQSTETRANHP